MRKGKNCLAIFILCLFGALSFLSASAAEMRQITVVIDDNYPPYSFRNAKGDLQGILIDQWQLWSQKTGVAVTVKGMDWEKALMEIRENKADVIDTIFFTEERAQYLDFTQPYVEIPVPVFHHKTLSGIDNVHSLQGFTVGVKAGDACIEFLKKNGITTIQTFNSYEEILKAAKNGKIKVFSVDEPCAHYYLIKMNLEDAFKQAFTMYTGQFHRAVRKGQSEMLKLIEDGFSSITPAEYRTIERRWKGQTVLSLFISSHRQYVPIILAIIGGAFLILISFIFIMNHRVRVKTHELEASLKKLRESEEKYRELVENANSIIMRRDREGCITFFNEYAQKFFGYMEKEILGRHVIGTIVPEQDSAGQDLRAMIADISRHPEKYTSIINENIKKDGSRVWVAWTNRPIYDEKGDLKEILCIGNDITERKQMEEESRRLQERLHQAEKMELIGTLAGGVAHDLNNVLGVLVGNAELLCTLMREGDENRQFVEKILKASLRGSAIVQDLLTLTRRAVAVKEVINLNTTIHDFFDAPEGKHIIDEHPEIEFVLDLSPHLKNIKASPFHVNKAIMNLILNAVESIDKSGKITIRTKNDPQAANFVTLSIADTGRGIPEADLERIYEPFYSKKKLGKSGTGLGLSVVWWTMQDHDGYIEVKSKEGEGTTFILHFPATEERETKSEEVSARDRIQGNGEKILIVDDVPEQRTLGVEVLKRLGYEAQAVSNGLDAVEFIKKNPVDLIILDMILEGPWDGLTTFEKIREVNPSQRAIIVSGYSETERVKQARLLGVKGFLGKPFTIESLGQAVKNALQ